MAACRLCSCCRDRPADLTLTLDLVTECLACDRAGGARVSPGCLRRCGPPGTPGDAVPARGTRWGFGSGQGPRPFPVCQIQPTRGREPGVPAVELRENPGAVPSFPVPDATLIGGMKIKNRMRQVRAKDKLFETVLTHRWSVNAACPGHSLMRSCRQPGPPLLWALPGTWCGHGALTPRTDPVLQKAQEVCCPGHRPRFRNRTRLRGTPNGPLPSLSPRHGWRLCLSSIEKTDKEPY